MTYASTTAVCLLCSVFLRYITWLRRVAPYTKRVQIMAEIRLSWFVTNYVARPDRLDVTNIKRYSVFERVHAQGYNAPP